MDCFLLGNVKINSWGYVVLTLAAVVVGPTILQLGAGLQGIRKMGRLKLGRQNKEDQFKRIIMAVEQLRCKGDC